MKKYQNIPEFIEDLEPDKRSQVEELRKIILETEKDLTENIKWNAPNYSYNGVDRITFNLLNKEGKVKILIHMGALKKENKNAPPVFEDKSGIVQWNSDIRGTIAFDSLEDIHKKEQSLKKILIDWLRI